MGAMEDSAVSRLSWVTPLMSCRMYLKVLVSSGQYDLKASNLDMGQYVSKQPITSMGAVLCMAARGLTRPTSTKVPPR